jgi:hypothetical protein
MSPRLLLFVAFAVLLLAAAPARAQDAADAAGSDASAEECAPEPFDMTADASAVASSEDAPPARVEALDAEALSAAEEAVRARITEEGVHVVRFWAPWCGNSLGEMSRGWDALVAANPDVTFTFVTVRNEGASARATMQEHDLPARVDEVTVPGTRDDKRFTFLGLPVTWIPTTWVFHDGGDLAFALNYGETETATLQTLLDTTQREW